MAQKTAMQEFLEWLENSSDVQNDILNWELVKENALEKEKEQIITAHYQGYRNDIGTTKVSEQYYNETFTSTQQGENPSATRIGQS